MKNAVDELISLAEKGIVEPQVISIKTYKTGKQRKNQLKQKQIKIY